MDCHWLARAFGGLEKGTQFYLASPLFWAMMALLRGSITGEIEPELKRCNDLATQRAVRHRTQAGG